MTVCPPSPPFVRQRRCRACRVVSSAQKLQADFTAQMEAEQAAAGPEGMAEKQFLDSGPNVVRQVMCHFQVSLCPALVACQRLPPSYLGTTTDD